MKTTKYIFAFCLFAFIFVFTTTFAQEANQTTKELATKELATKVQQRDSRNGTDGTTAVGNKIKIRGTSSVVILKIEEETNGAASLIMNDKNNFGSNKKLFNADGNLMWGGDQLSTVSGGTTYSVGDFAQGGIVFWVDETAEHGLVCTKEDQNGGSLIRWYAGTNGNTQARGDGPFSGEMNTSIIISAQVAIGDDGTTYAARVCSELQVTEGGKTYGDWYLPSKQEINLMYINKATINTTAEANSGHLFAASSYWSSTEYSNSFAWTQQFNSGNLNANNKNIAIFVRAVRAF
ncbi:MAG: DUF1566 domain-containing protein [Melioribacteraceae bacterium]